MPKSKRARLQTPTDPLLPFEFPWTTLGLIVVLLLGAIVCLIIKSELEGEFKWGKFGIALLEHGSSALIVAAVMGLSYELLLHSQREATFRRLFIKHRETTFEALKAFMLLTPKNIFRLLEDIATQTSKIPTLYEPPREEGNEFVFSHSREYFDSLVQSGREDVIKVLASWIERDSPVNLKFLAGDFIGMYRLAELAEELKAQAHGRLSGGSKLSDHEKSWALNYLWAASRCETPIYHSLGRLLTDHANDDFIQRWILFVPRQMQDPELCDVLRSYLEKQGESISEENRIHVAKALAALARAHGKKARAILDEYGELFSSDHLKNKVREAWLSLELPQRFRHRTVDTGAAVETAAPPSDKSPTGS